MTGGRGDLVKGDWVTRGKVTWGRGKGKGFRFPRQIGISATRRRRTSPLRSNRCQVKGFPASPLAVSSTCGI